MQTFEYVLFHISKFINNLTLRKIIRSEYRDYLEETYSNEDGNYTGDEKFEQQLHELEREIEHQEFNIDKWFKRTVEIIEDKYNNPD